MAVRAIAFDIGGVLERVGPAEQWLGPWCERLGMGAADFELALASRMAGRPADEHAS